MREAVAAASAILLVSALGLFVTYYFSRQAQLDAVRNELAQLARVVAASIDGDLHRVAAQTHMEGTPEYLRALVPMVRFHRATKDVIYVYTYTLHDGSVRFGLDSAYLYRVPGNTETYDPPMSVYDGNDVDARRALETQTLAVNAKPTLELTRTYLSAYAPFYDSKGQFVGVAGVDMFLPELEARLAGLRRIVAASFAGLVLISALAGLIVFRLRSTAAEAAARDRQAVVDLAAARDAAEQSSRAKSAFLAMMSHELRTPLNGIVGFSELIHDELTSRGDVSLSQDVGRVLAASRHLTAIISDVLDYSKIEAGHLELHPARVDVPALLVELVELMKPSASIKGLTIALDVHPSVRPVVTDPLRTRQVVLNLLGNAVKFSDAGAVTVRVRQTTSPPRLVCTVHDAGVGIPVEKRALLFRPFSQIDSSMARSAGGTGLGLVISLRIVEAMRGRLTFRSRVGVGSTFRVSIPAIPA